MLSQLLIAYTYEFDAALKHELGEGFEHAPSLAMWANVLRFVGPQGVSSGDLKPLSGIAAATLKSMLDCLKRHGWVLVNADGLVQLTSRGSKAAAAFPKAQEAVERQWEASWGLDVVTALRNALEAACARLSREFPHYPMPAAHRGALPTGE